MRPAHFGGLGIEDDAIALHVTPLELAPPPISARRSAAETAPAIQNCRAVRRRSRPQRSPDRRDRGPSPRGRGARRAIRSACADQRVGVEVALLDTPAEKAVADFIEVLACAALPGRGIFVTLWPQSPWT